MLHGKNDRLAICVIGTGFGRQLASLLKDSQDVNVSLCGNDVHKTKRIASDLGGLPTYPSIEAAVLDPRVAALVLAVPHHLHHPFAKLALEMGKHVFIEKPIATQLRDADELIALADAKGLVLASGENVSFRPDILAAKRLVSDGVIGEPLFLTGFGVHAIDQVGWRNNQQEMGGGIVIDTGVHDVRVMRTLMGEPAKVVATRSRQVLTQMGGEDNALILFEGDGWTAQILTAWSATAGSIPEFILFGHQGTIHIWAGAGYVDLYPVSPTFTTRIVAKIRPWWLREYLSSSSNQRKRIPLGYEKDRMGYRAELQEFVTNISSSKPSIEAAQQGRRDLELILLAQQAMVSGRSVRIPAIGPNLDRAA
jgi:predicted dehydrogenase